MDEIDSVWNFVENGHLLYDETVGEKIDYGVFELASIKLKTIGCSCKDQTGNSSIIVPIIERIEAQLK